MSADVRGMQLYERFSGPLWCKVPVEQAFKVGVEVRNAFQTKDRQQIEAWWATIKNRRDAAAAAERHSASYLNQATPSRYGDDREKTGYR